MTWVDQRVLVTGGAGFIGSHLVDRLDSAGADITILDLSKERRFDATTLWTANIRHCNWDRLADFDVIFHLAANAYVPPSVEDPRADNEINFQATLNILEELRKTKWPGRFIYASSAAVYGNPVTSPIKEGDPTVPVSPYGVGKLAAERYCDVYAKLYGLNIASMRLFSVYGPRQRKQVVYDLMCKIDARTGILRIHGDGTQSRDFLYVEDAAVGAMAIAEKAEMTGEVYNLGYGGACTIDELAQWLCQEMNAEPQFQYTGSNRPGDPEKLVVDISKLEKLGYRPQTDLITGIRPTVEWFKARN